VFLTESRLAYSVQTDVLSGKVNNNHLIIQSNFLEQQCNVVDDE
jgi:hypothetical protein